MCAAVCNVRIHTNTSSACAVCNLLCQNDLLYMCHMTQANCLNGLLPESMLLVPLILLGHTCRSII